MTFRPQSSGTSAYPLKPHPKLFHPTHTAGHQLCSHIFFLNNMREFLTAVWRKKQRKAGQRSKDQIRKPAQDLPLPAGPPHEQSQSLLFSQLPTELRLAVYREALVSDLLLHILHELPDNGELDRLGHWRCDDPENPHMIWQHKCFGLDRVNTNWLYRMTPRTNGNLLGILLACRSR
jgi:hypothetical protein